MGNEDIMPVIMTHQGYSWYLDYALKQARSNNAKENVILLGDYSNGFSFITHARLKEYSNSISSFTVKYQHLSENDYNYELFCFQRWFIVRDYMRQHNIAQALICDTDVMLYVDTLQMLSLYSDKDAYLMIPENPVKVAYSVNGAASIWKLATLEAFCNFLENFYEECKEQIAAKMEYHLSRRAAGDKGGICDMTALYFFYLKHTGSIGNILSVKNSSSVAISAVGAINEFRDEYDTNNGFKNLLFKESVPYCYNKLHQEEVKFFLVHFQGSSKSLIRSHYNGNLFSPYTFRNIFFSIINMPNKLKRKVMYRVKKIRGK